MINLKGYVLSECGYPIVPEHPILATIKTHCKDSMFRVNTIYFDIDDCEVQEVIRNMRDFGNYPMHRKTIAQIECIPYKGDYVGNWYEFLSLTERDIKHSTSKIICGLNKYRLLGYGESVEHDTFISTRHEHLILENTFSSRFSFNKLGRDYLVNKLKDESEYYCLILSPNDTVEFVTKAVSYLHSEINEKPEEPDFKSILGSHIKKCIDYDLFDCSNIVLVSSDLVVLAFDKNSEVNVDKLKEDFTVIYASDFSIDSGVSISDDIDTKD